MKKIKILLLLALTAISVFLFAACESQGVGVARVYVNEELHAIVEYTDGTTEDLGYVGKDVEVAPPKYTVTFLDADGEVLKTESIYKGDAATAPEAPEIDEKAFDHWDVDYSAVTGDLTVRPVYVAAAEYTVTFVDENGATIDTVKVIHGKAATAPIAPTREDTIFKEWDKAFDNVKNDLTVTAVYRNKETYTVTFKDYTGLTLGTASVKETGTATAPVAPTRNGYTFAGWSGALTNITENKTVTAKYNLVSGANLIDYSYAVKADGTVELTVSVTGTVGFAVLEATLALPEGITEVAYEGLSGAVVNKTGNAIGISFSTARNVTQKTDVLKVTFKADKNATQLAFDVTVKRMVDDTIPTPVNVSYTVIGDALKLK